MGSSLHDVVVVLAAHGDRGGDAPNSVLHSHRDAIAALGVVRSVVAGVLKGEPQLEAALAEAAAAGPHRIAIYPMFMAAGYFTNKVLPDRVQAAGLERSCKILAPLGLDPGLPDLVLRDALGAASAAGMAPKSARLLIVGHGSKLGPASANATRAVARAVARADVFQSLATAFLEEPPFLDDVLARLNGPTIVSGFFSGEGLHAQEDVPEAIREAGTQAIYAGSIGRSLELPRIVLDAVRAAMASPA